MAVLWLLEAILLGCLLVHRFAGFSEVRPAWARRSLIFGAGAAAGIALSSFLFFLCGALLGMRAAAMGVEAAVLAWVGYQVPPAPCGATPGGANTRAAAGCHCGGRPPSGTRDWDRGHGDGLGYQPAGRLGCLGDLEHAGEVSGV